MMPVVFWCATKQRFSTLSPTARRTLPAMRRSPAAISGRAILAPELSRGFRALKVWFTIQEHGTRALGDAIARNCAQAQSLAAQIANRPILRLAAPVPLQIVCCRLEPPGMGETAADALNAEIVATLQRRGIAAPSTCRIDGRVCIRVNITNHRTRDADLTLLVQAIETIGAELTEITTAEPKRAAS
jgi:aromatic-L-amino-acid/L-tryptophan decarboxylase